jgi:hypothetical protein
VAIEAFFLEHLGERFRTSVLHERFGPAFRTRVSELNRDPICTIRILNETSAGRDDRGQSCERSVYWAELRSSNENYSDPKPGESEYMRRTRDEQARAMPLFAEVRK